MASRTVRINNPWALRVPNIETAYKLYGKDKVKGLAEDGFVIFESEEAGVTGANQEFDAELAKDLTVGQHLVTHVGKDADPEGYANAVINVPKIATQLSGQPVTVDTPLADVDRNVYLRTIAQNEGGTDAVNTFFPPDVDYVDVRDRPSFTSTKWEDLTDDERASHEEPFRRNPLLHLLGSTPKERYAERQLQDAKDKRFETFQFSPSTKKIEPTIPNNQDEAFDIGLKSTLLNNLAKSDPSRDNGASTVTEGDEIDQIITEEEQKTSPTVTSKPTSVTPPSVTNEVPPTTTARTDGTVRGKMLPTLLQALGAGGASYLENKAIKDANAATRQNQARANLINALARGGRAGAVTETPTTGMGTALFKSLSALGEGEERRRKEAADEAYRQQQLELDKEELAADTKHKEKVLAAKNTVDELRSHKDAVTQISEFLQNGAEAGRVNYNNFKEQIAASPAIAELYAQLPDSHKPMAESGLAIGLSTRETPPEPVEMKSMVQTMRDLYNAIEDPSSWLTAAGYKRLGSLGELLYGTEGDFDSIIQSQFMPARTTYDGVRSANTLRLASAFNQGRPSDKDAQLVSRLIPQFGLSDSVNEARFAVLEQMAALAEEMAKTGFDPLAAGYGENFLTQSGAVIIGND